MRVKIEYSSRDGRAQRSEIVIVHGDDTAKLLTQGAWLQVLDLLISELGPNPKGMYMASDPLLAYTSHDRCSANVRLPGPADDAPGRPLRNAQLIATDSGAVAREAKRLLARITQIDSGGGR